MIVGSVATPADGGPLNEQHYAEIRQALVRQSSLRQMTGRARNSAIVTIFLAACSTMLMIFWPSLPGAVASAGLWIIGLSDLWAHHDLLCRRPRAATVLAINQMALLALIIAYCTLQILSFSPESANQQVSRLSPMLGTGDTAQLMGQIRQWSTTATYGFYGLIMLLSLVFQGLRIAYYLRKRADIETFNRQTPVWIQRLIDEMRR